MVYKIIIGIVIFISFAGILGYSFTKKYSKLGDTFITLLNEHKMQEAYAMFRPELQKVIPFIDFETNFKFTSKVVDISWNSREVENNKATIKGKLIFENGDKFSTEIIFFKENSQWKILEIDISPISVVQKNITE